MSFDVIGSRREIVNAVASTVIRGSELRRDGLPFPILVGVPQHVHVGETDRVVVGAGNPAEDDAGGDQAKCDVL